MRIGERLCAIRDECPHAGASLADGVLEGTIITCLRRGSQFDVTIGARERGPPDFPIRTQRVASEAGTTLRGRARRSVVDLSDCNVPIDSNIREGI